MRIIYPLFFIILIIAGSCRQPPTFMHENPLDPENPAYIAPVPSQVELLFNSSTNQIEISWLQFNSAEYGIEGFRISRSTTSPDSLRFAAVVQSTDKSVYTYVENFVSSTLLIFYGVQAFSTQGFDTTYSEIQMVQFSNEPEFNFEVQYFPLIENEGVSLRWNGNTVSELYFDVYTNRGTDTTLVATITPGSDIGETYISYPFVNPDHPILVRLRNDVSQTWFYLSTTPPSSVIPRIRIDHTSVSSNIIELDAFIETQMDSLEGSTQHQIKADQLDFQIEMLNRGGQVVKDETITVIDPGSNEVVIINNADTTLTYRITSTLVRGDFTSSGASVNFSYRSDVELINTQQAAFSSEFLTGDVSTSSSRIVVASSNIKPTVYDINKGNRVVLNDVEISQIYDVSFIYPPNSSSEHVLISQFNGGITEWELTDNNIATYIKSHPSYPDESSHIIRFTPVSVSEVAVLSCSNRALTSGQICYFTLYNLENESHQLLETFDRTLHMSLDIIFNKELNLIHLIRSYDVINAQPETQIVNYSLSDGQLQKQFVNNRCCTESSSQLSVFNSGQDLIWVYKHGAIKMNSIDLDELVRWNGAEGPYEEMKSVLGSTDSSINCVVYKHSPGNYRLACEYFVNLMIPSDILEEDRVIHGGFMNDNASLLLLLFDNELAIYQMTRNWERIN